MQNKSITLPQEVWDRVVEILDSQPNPHPDTTYILTSLQNQLSYSPGDMIPPLPPRYKTSYGHTNLPDRRKVMTTVEEQHISDLKGGDI